MLKWLQGIISRGKAAASVPCSPDSESPVPRLHDDGQEEVHETTLLQKTCQGMHDPLRIGKHSDTLLPARVTGINSIKVREKHFRNKVSTPVSQRVQNGSRHVECSLIPSTTSDPKHRQPTVPGTQLTTATTVQLLPASSSSNTQSVSGTPHAHSKSPLMRDTWQTATPDVSITSLPATPQLTSLDVQLAASDTHIAAQTIIDTEVSATPLDTHLITAANMLQISTKSDTHRTSTSSPDTHPTAVATPLDTHLTATTVPDTHLTAAVTPDTHTTATLETHLKATTSDTRLTAQATPDTHFTATTPDTHPTGTAIPGTHLTAASTPDTHPTAAATPLDTHLTTTTIPDTHLTAAATPHTDLTAATPHTHLTTATPDTLLRVATTPDTHLTAAAIPDTHTTITATPDAHLTFTATPDTHLFSETTPDSHLTATTIPDTQPTAVTTPDAHLTAVSTYKTHPVVVLTPDTQLPAAAIPDTQLTAAAIPDTHRSTVTTPDVHLTTVTTPNTHLTATTAITKTTDLHLRKAIAPDTHLTAAAAAASPDTHFTATISLDRHLAATPTPDTHTIARTTDTHLTATTIPNTHLKATTPDLTAAVTPDIHLIAVATPNTHLTAGTTPDTHLTSTATPDTHLTATSDTHLTAAATPYTHLTATTTPDTYLTTSTANTHLTAATTLDTYITAAATPDTHLTTTTTPVTHLTATATPVTHLTATATPDTHLTATATPDSHITATATPDKHLTATATPDAHLVAATSADTHITATTTPDTHLTASVTPDTHLTVVTTPFTNVAITTGDMHLRAVTKSDTHFTESSATALDTHLTVVTTPDTHLTTATTDIHLTAVTTPDTHITAAAVAASDTQLTVATTSDTNITAAAASDTQLMVVTTPNTQHIQAPDLQLPAIAQASQLITSFLQTQQKTETQPMERGFSSPPKGIGQKKSVFESSIMESEQNRVTCKNGNMAMVDGQGSIPCHNPYPCCHVSLCLYGQQGTLATILGERYILTLLEGASVPVCIRLQTSEDQISVCRVLWQGEKAIPLSQVLDGTQVEFDAICSPSTGTLVAVIIWQDTKPTVCVQPAGKESYIMISGYGFCCGLDEVDEITESVIVNFDDHIVCAEVSRDVVFVNGRKSHIWELRRHGLDPIFATVFQLLKGDVAGSVTYVCTCLWTGQIPEISKLPMLLKHRQAYVKKSRGLYVKSNETFILFCDIDSALTISEKAYKLTFKVDGVEKSLQITRDQLYTEEKGQISSITSKMHLKAHISCRNKDGQILWTAQMGKLPSTSSCSTGYTGSQANAQMNITLDYRHVETGKEDILEGLVNPGLKGPQNEYAKEVCPASQSESATNTTSTSSPTGQVRRRTSNIGSLSDQGGLKTGETCSSSDHVRLETIINCSSIASQPKLENLTCSVAKAGTDMAILSATGKFIIVTKDDFFINTEKLLASVSLQTELKRFPNVDTVSYENNDPIRISGCLIKHTAIVAWAGKKPTNIDEIVKAWECKSFQTSNNKNEILFSKTLKDISSQKDKVFKASGGLVDVFCDTGILLLRSKHIEGGTGDAIVCLSCMYKDGFPVDRSQLKSIPAGQMWHCLVQQRPPHEVKDGDPKYRVNLAWQGQKPRAFCYSSLKDGKTKLHQSSSDDTLSSHMKSFSCSTSSLTDQERPQTSSTSSLTDQVRPQIISTSNFTGPGRLHAKSTDSLTVKGRPQTSNTSCLTDHLRSVSSSTNSFSDQTKSVCKKNNSCMDQAQLQTNINHKSVVSQSKLKYLTCTVAEAGTDIAILSAARKFILVIRDDFFINKKKLKDSANLKDELKRFPNVGAMLYETEYPIEMLGFVINHAAVVAWAGKKSPDVDEIVKAWESKTFKTSDNKNEASSSKMLKDSLSLNDERFQASGVLKNVHPVTGTLMLHSKHIEGGTGEATVHLSCMYKDGLPVDKKQLKSIPISCMWNCLAQKRPPHNVKNGKPKYWVILAWQGIKPSASYYSSLKDRKTQLRQSSSYCSLSSHMQLLSTSTSSLTGQGRPQTSSTSSLTDLVRPKTSSTSSLTGQRRPQTSSTSSFTGLVRPKTSNTSSLTGQGRPQTSSTSSLTGLVRPQTSSTSCLTGQIWLQTGSTSSLTGQGRPQTSSTGSLTGLVRPKTSSTSSLTGQVRPQTSSTSSLTGLVRPQTSSTSCLTGQIWPQTGSTSSLTGQGRPQTSSTSSLTGQIWPQTGSTSSLTDQGRPQTSSTNSLAGQGRPQTSSTNSLTGQERPQTSSTSSLTGQGRPQTSSTNSLTGQGRPQTSSTNSLAGQGRPQTSSTNSLAGQGRPHTSSTNSLIGQERPQTSSTSSLGDHCELKITKAKSKRRKKKKTTRASTLTDEFTSEKKCGAFSKGQITEIHRTIGQLETENGIVLYFTRDCCFLYGLCLHHVELWHVLTLGLEVEFELSKGGTRVKGVWVGSRPHQQPKPLIPLVTAWCRYNSVPKVATQILLREAESFSSRFFPTASCNSEEEIIDITYASS